VLRIQRFESITTSGYTYIIYLNFKYINHSSFFIKRIIYSPYCVYIYTLSLSLSLSLYIYIYIYIYMGWRVSDLKLQDIEHILMDCHNCSTDSAFELLYRFTEEF
jgi:hypothetical protein